MLPDEEDGAEADEDDAGDPGRRQHLVEKRRRRNRDGRVGDAREERVDGQHLEATEREQ